MNDKKTWEETIEFIRTQPDYKDLVAKAYFEADLPVNVERFRKSEEFIETLKLLKEFQSNAKTILDIGSGNGISSIALALEGYEVVTVEPDPSKTIGAGAIRILKEYYKLKNIDIYETYAEEIKFPSESFDIVYTRQCMHHAYDLNKFVLEASRVLKKGGLLITVRDHVIFNPKDKEWFLESHPLQKFYGGENAFTYDEYSLAMSKADLDIKLVLKHFDSPINYFPLTKIEKIKEEEESINFINSIVSKKLGFLSKIEFFKELANRYVKGKLGLVHNENKVPGRMYTFLSTKK